MSLLIATPMFGGQCTAEYFNSCLDLRGMMVHNEFKHDWLVTTNESLITRARNTAVARFMKTDYERFMFIDADIEFQADDVLKLWNLDVDVATAAYPMKREGSDVTAWKDGKLVKLDELEGPTEIDYAGTGFLMIKRHVFEKLQEYSPSIKHEEGKIGECWAHFDTGVVTEKAKDMGWKDRFYCSEDYWFCRGWRKLMGKIILEPSIRLGHVGRRVYR